MLDECWNQLTELDFNNPMETRAEKGANGKLGFCMLRTHDMITVKGGWRIQGDE